MFYLDLKIPSIPIGPEAERACRCGNLEQHFCQLCEIDFCDCFDHECPPELRYHDKPEDMGAA